MIPIKRILLAAAAALLSLPLAAQVSFTGNYTENFDSLGTGTNLASLTGWSHIGNLGGSNSSWTTSIPASGAQSAATAGTANNTLIVNSAVGTTGSNNAQAYNFALSTSTADRCIGTSPTSGAGNILQLRLTNNTGAAMNSIGISYDIRRFSAPGTNDLPGYWLFYSVNGGTTWANVSALNPAASGATVNVPNSTGVTNVALTTITLASAVANGSEIRLRWIDDNANQTSPDQIYGLDNVVISAAGGNTPPSVSISAPTNGSIATAPATVSLSATATDNGSVTQVEFLRNGTVIHTDTTSPYAFSDSGLGAGNYSYTARATDNLGSTTTSTAVAVNVFTNPANTALLFDGVNDYVTMGAAPALNAGGPPSNGFTLECWFRKEGAGITSSSGSGGVSAVPLFGKGRGEAENSNVDCNYFFGITTGGLLAADFEAYPASGITAGQNYPLTATHTPIVNNTWYHAAVTYDGTTTTWKVYLDGTQVGTATAAANALPRYDSIQHFGIGAAFNSSGGSEGAFAGRIDEVRVWNYARTATEIATAKNLEIASATGLVGRYGLNEGTGITTANSPNSGFPAGTLTNGPLWVDGVTFTQNTPPTVALTAPGVGASFDAPASISLAATAADTDGIGKVEFFNGATKLGEDSSAPYELVWNNVISGNYALTAVATDALGAAATSTAVTVSVANTNNIAPGVALTAPTNGSIIVINSVTLSADATDTDGVVAKVEFFNGSTKLGEDTTSPYSFNWTGVATGNYTITVVATDNDTGTTTSTPVSFSVAVPITTTLLAKGGTWKYLDNGSDQGTAWKETTFNDSAWASGTAPLGGGDTHIVTSVNLGPASPNRYITTYFRRSFNVSGAAAVQALNMNILRDDGVVVYINGTEVARQNMPAGEFTYLTNAPLVISGSDETTYFPSSAAPMPTLVDGANTIAVELHQRDGTSSDLGFDMELISVALPGTPPTVAITAPTDSASFTAPAAIAFTANAADSDGTVSKVEFFNGATKLGEDLMAPYTFDWTVVPQGSYTLTAKATDNFGLTTTSTAVNITVEPPNTIAPTVAITAPANNSNFIAPVTVAITADAADTDGTVSKVEFFNGATKLGEDTNSPYSFDWVNVPAGDYTLTAKATDNLTATTTSSQVVIHVMPNQAPVITPTFPADLAGVPAPATDLRVSLSDAENQPLTATFYGRSKVAAPGPDFTLVTLPDTQFYSSNTSYFSNFTAQTQWIVAQRNALNIAFVSHMGDMTDGATAAEYVRANTAMSVLEDPVTTGLPYGIPWGGAPGNHDSSGWDTTFGPSRFAGRSYFQGNYPSGSAVNSYQFFTAGGLDFLHINLAMYPTTAALTWADGILKANPNRRAILTSHSILNVGGSQTSWTSEGTTIYGALKGNPNLFLMLCGHNHGIGRRVDVDNGNTIYSVLQDYQSEANGGDSWLRYFTFSPATNKITANVIRCRDGARRTDAESQFEMTYNMQSSAPWTDLGTVNVSAGSTTASIPWSGLAVGTGYEWYATVSDGVTPVTSSTRSFTAVTPTSPPTVVITAPANGTSLIAPATITVTADASDTDGTVSKVEFFNGATKLGEDLSEPFSFEWTGVPIGDYTLTARATDNMTATSVSAALVIHVIEDPRPRVTLAATDATAGEYGSDRGLGFTVSRTGPTTRALVVPLVAGGTASAGSDFTGFSNSVTIPAGSASLALSLTILSDDLVEGTETVTISLGSSPDFVTGSPASANATITDRLAPTAAWRFGVIGDTQQTQNVNSTNNSCAINIISAVNQQFVARNVDMVLAAGDLADNGSVASLQTRLAANAGTLSGITGLGSIPFYAVRGNHDDNSSAQTYFQGNFIPASNAGVTVSLAPDNTSYAVNYKGASFVFLDILATKGTTSTMDQQTTWMNSVLGSDGHEHAFVVQHKNLLGQNHKDNAFGSSNDANPTQQNNFFKVLSDNGVRYNISGHDHMNHRAIVTSPDGNYKVQQIITQSASTKFYNGTTPYSSREQCVSDEQDKIGFYIYTVEGSKITGEYWATDPVGSDIPANPVWTLRDTFGYSINGKQATVARDGSYAGITDSTAKAVSNGETGYLGTSMSILAGTNTNTGTAGGSRPEVDDLNTGWAPKPATLASDVLTLWGMNNALGSTQTDTFTLSLSYDPAISHPMLVTRVGNDWVNAVSGNTGGTSNYAGNRPFNAGTDTLGSYGFDSTTHTAWAVINHDSDFAVMPDLTRPTVTIVATDNTSGEFNSDPTLVFTLSRTGSTAAPLSVTLTAGGSATSGADYSGFTSPVIFPAGSATATVTLTVLADNAAEGPETVTLALDSSPQIFVGSPASANASIADSPAQNFYYTNIPDPALRGPNQDTDGDGVPNALEFAFGLNPTANDGGPIIVDGSSITRLGQMPSMRIAGSAVSAVFGRRQNYQESGLTYKVKFSSDLGTWYDSTDTVNLKYAGTPDLSHPAVVASQGDMDAVSIPFPLFIKTANGYEKTQSFMMIEVTTP